jgi:hypothetical protein
LRPWAIHYQAPDEVRQISLEAHLFFRRSDFAASDELKQLNELERMVPVWLYRAERQGVEYPATPDFQIPKNTLAWVTLRKDNPMVYLVRKEDGSYMRPDKDTLIGNEEVIEAPELVPFIVDTVVNKKAIRQRAWDTLVWRDTFASEEKPSQSE